MCHQTGWMMWNWLVSCLAVGAAIVCYDGSPLVPTPNILWDLIDKIGLVVNNYALEPECVVDGCGSSLFSPSLTPAASVYYYSRMPPIYEQEAI